MQKEHIALAQGPYFVATGVWPLVHMSSFVQMTGPKAEGWLVKTVGGLVAAIGAGLTLAGMRRKVAAEAALIGAGSALALAAVELYYGGKRRIRRIYLADALVEVALAAGWVTACRSQRVPS